MTGLLCYASNMDIHDKFHLLKKEIKTASRIAHTYFNSSDFSNESKSDGSVVTEIDKEIEEKLRAFVAKHFPDDEVVGEEGDNVPGTSGFVWYIDPIDGTDNFLRKIPFCAVSVARLGDTAEDSFAIIHNPITDHTFSVMMDGGVYEDERVVSCLDKPLWSRYLITTAIVVREPWVQSAKYNMQAALEREFGKCVSYSSAALQQAYLAAGRMEGFFTTGLGRHDYAAGLYLVRAAGGKISLYEDGQWRLAEESIKDIASQKHRTIFVSRPEIHDRALELIGDPKQWADEVK